MHAYAPTTLTSRESDGGIDVEDTGLYDVENSSGQWAR